MRYDWRRLFAAALPLAVLTALCTGCGGDAAAPETRTAEHQVLGLLLSHEDAVTAELAASILTEAGARGYQVRCYDAGNDPETQLRQVHQALAEGIGTLLVDLADGEASEKLAGIVGDAGVVLIGRTPETAILQERLVLVGADEAGSGVLQGQALADYFWETDHGTEVRCLLFQGAGTDVRSDSAVQTLLYDGFFPIAAAGDQVCGPSRAEARRDMTALLAERVDYDCVICDSDEMALGVIDALEAAGCTPDMTAEAINDALIAAFPTITLTGLTGDGEGITWDSTGAVSKAPKGMVIEKGADGKIHVLTVSEVEEADAGKQVVFHVKVNEVKEKQTPALDDEFAKDVSEFETLKELKDDTKAKITAEREQSAKIAFENALLEKVAGDIKADIPEVMIEEQCRRFLDEFKQRLQAQGIPYDQYCKMTGMDEAKFMEDGREPAVRQVKMDLAIAAIIKAENLDVTDEEIEEKYKSMAEQYGMELDMLKKYLDAPTVRNQLLNEKAIAVVVDSAKAEKPTKAEKTEGEEEKKPAKKTAKKAAEGEEEKKPAAKKTTKKAAEGEEEKKPAKKTAKKAAEKAE